jgi:hypothetical protein
MKQKSRYVFGAALAGAAFGGVPQMIHRANGAIVTAAAFTFETSYVAFFPPITTTSTVTATSSTNFGTTGTAYASVTGTSVGPFLAESGAGSAYGVHAASTTIFSTPAGNGSVHSLSSTTWAIGDYYQFSVPTTLLSDVQVSFDEAGSNTGPGAFSLAYSLDGTTFSTFTNYGLPYSSVSSASAFGASTTNTAEHFSFDLTAVTGLAGDSSAVFRIVDASTLAYSSTAPVAAGGTDRVDNFVVSGDAAVGVPEPATLSLVAVAAAGLLSRKKRI